MKQATWSAAIRHANLSALAEDIRTLESGGIHEVHLDIMDGHFTPELGLGLDTVRAVRTCTELPLNAHLMIQHPERHVDSFVQAGCNSVTFHVEAAVHAHRVIHQIKDAGAQAGIAVNPATPLTKLEYLLPDADRVHLMLAETDPPEHDLTSSSLDRVKIIRDNLNYHESPAQLVVEGNITVKNAALLISQGADVIVLDNSSIFTTESLSDAVARFLDQVEEASKTL